MLALGDGASALSSESAVAVGCHHAVEKDCLVTVHSHPGYAVDWRFQALGNGGETTFAHEVAEAREAESEEEYDDAPTPPRTRGRRAGLHTNSGPGTSASYDGALFFARHTAADTLTAARSTATDAWAA